MPDTFEVAPSGDFGDEHRCDTELSQVLIDAQEVDLGGLDELFLDLLDGGLL